MATKTQSDTPFRVDYRKDPSVPSFDGDEDLHPTDLRVGAHENIRTQVWTATTENWEGWPRVNSDFVVCKSEIAVSRGRSVVTMADVSNAFIRGRSCRKYRIKSPDVHCHGQGASPDERPEGFVLAMGGVTDAFEWLEARSDEEFEGDRYSEYLDHHAGGTRFRIYRESAKAIRTFSAAHLDQVTPLSSEPKSWNVRKAMRAVLSGQISRWHVDGIYTDDYARDNALNFQRGELEKFLGKARRIWEDPSGWKVWASDAEDSGSQTNLSLNCHHFDNNTVDIDLSAEALPIDRLTCLRKRGEHPDDRFE